MELVDAVHRRRMVRRYAPDPVDPAVVDRLLALAVRAPSAGFAQGWAFLVLDRPEDVDRFWNVTSPSPGADSRWLRGMRTAPVVVVPMAGKQAYLDRYAEPDKGWTDRDESRWPAPYWQLDTAMASLLVLLGAVDEGLGGCFFGIPVDRLPAFGDAFGVPASHRPIGAMTLGHPATDGGEAGRGSRGRGRRPMDQVVHRGRW
ncbi:MAG: nitroreductase family protein [Nocardioidaceae bacterium]|nr:nitroreductase family protein [Nocardioidaceae bacterium]